MTLRRLNMGDIDRLDRLNMGDIDRLDRLNMGDIDRLDRLESVGCLWELDCHICHHFFLLVLLVLLMFSDLLQAVMTRFAMSSSEFLHLSIISSVTFLLYLQPWSNILRTRATKD